LNNNIAILDLGTNTFHLLIVEVWATSYKILYKEKQFVKLGEYGLENLNEVVLNRAIDVTKYYQKKLTTFKVTDAIIFGTAGLRMASNAEDLTVKIEEITGYKVKIISGADEAKLIYYGVKQGLPNYTQNYLIMDIGGGSVEFILINNSNILWAQSFNIGVSLLKNKYHTSEPINSQKIDELYQFFEIKLNPLITKINDNPVQTLVGASGSFDTIADMSKNVAIKEGFVQLPLTDFSYLTKNLVAKTYEERLSTEDLVNDRADMIVVALLLIDFTINKLDIKEMYKSDFALKEGIIWAYLNDPEYLNTL